MSKGASQEGAGMSEVAAIRAPSRPVMRYHGGKWRLADWIISFFPAHQVYIEPFGGAASVLLRKPQAFAEIWNDLDDEVVNIFRVLRDPVRAHELRRRCELTGYARTEFEDAYLPTDDLIERARRMLIRSWMGHGASGVRAHRTGFRVNPHRQRTTAAMDWESWPEQIPLFVERLRRVKIERRPAAKLIADHNRDGVLIYCDPPYMFATRSQKRVGNDLYHGYRHELTDAQHAALLEQLISARAMIVLSGYGSALYDTMLAGWQRHETHAFADRGGGRTEVVWLNPACAAARDLDRAGAGTPLFAGAAE